jgi:hypothetical protein
VRFKFFDAIVPVVDRFLEIIDDLPDRVELGNFPTWCFSVLRGLDGAALAGGAQSGYANVKRR